MEPYRVRQVETIPILTAEQRRTALAEAHYNAFNLPSSAVTIDLLSDSGTAATSTEQEAAALLAPTNYAGRTSYYDLVDSFREVSGYEVVQPVHQGRAAERILFSTLLGPGKISISNTHFDTTRGNVEVLGARAVDLPCPESKNLDGLDAFKGNMDVGALAEFLAGPDADQVGLVLMTITNNGGGGQPVSMANLSEVSALCRQHQVPFFLDAARFAENAWLVTRREPQYQAMTPRQVAAQAFALADGCVASLKKDGLTGEGAVIGLREAGPDLLPMLEALTTLGEGHTSYGGLTGGDMARLAVGLREVLDPGYLAAREEQTARFASLVREAGVDIVEPPGMHALYLNAGRLLPHLTPDLFPGHALACQLYLAGGIRCSELGSLYLGVTDEQHRLVGPAPYELVRLAIPRRVYLHSHFEYVAEILDGIAKDPHQVPGYRIVKAPQVLRPFKVELEQVPAVA